MKRILKRLSPLYPFILFAILFSVMVQEESKAGRIRALILKPEQPGKIYLSPGESTAITFPAKPEKLSPGSPNKIHIEFVTNTDITVTPLSSSHQLGNLIVYTKSGRYVVLFEASSGALYDDAVNIRFGQSSPPLHLQEDTYVADNVKLTLKPRSKGKDIKIEVPALFTTQGNKISGDELFSSLKDLKSLQCSNCSIVRKLGDQKILCRDIITSLSCENSQYSKIILVRGHK